MYSSSLNPLSCLRNWWDILNLFSNTSGLMLNVTKILLIGFNMSKEGVEEWAEEFQCKIGAFLISYLGFSLGWNQQRKAFWNMLVAKLKAKWMVLIDRHNDRSQKRGL